MLAGASRLPLNMFCMSLGQAQGRAAFEAASGASVGRYPPVNTAVAHVLFEYPA